MADASHTRFSSPAQWLSFGTVFAPAVITVLIVYAALRGAGGHVAGPVVFLIVFAGVWLSAWSMRRRFPRTASFVRFMLPLMLYGAFYSGIHVMLAAAGHPLIDAQLAAIDRAMFGTDPVIWLGTYGHPLVTDVLSLCYFSYYLGMPILMILMWRTSPEPAFRMALAAAVIGWYGALLTYMLFPALGPNRFTPELMPALRGWLPTTAWIQAFLHANLPVTVRDSIPSMHTGVTLLTLAFARRYQRRFFRAYLVPGLGLIAATMYLQQHYVIDVVLGIIAFALIYGGVVRFKPQ